VNLAVKEIRGHDDFAESEGDGDSSDDDTNKKAGIVDSSKLFGVKSLKPTIDARDTGKELDAEKVLKAARKVTGGKDDSDSDDSSDGAGRHAVVEKAKEQQKPAAATKASKSSTKGASGGATMVQFGEADLKDFNADKNKLIKETAGPGLDETELLKSLFVTQ